MPPNQMRSTGLLRIAAISCVGSSASAWMSSAALISGDSGIDFISRANTPPPGEISERS